MRLEETQEDKIRIRGKNIYILTSTVILEELSPLTKTQAGNELGSTVRHRAVWVERFQEIGCEHQ